MASLSNSFRFMRLPHSLHFFISALFVVGLSNTSCMPKAPEEVALNPMAVSLNDSAMLLVQAYDSLQIEEALGLWEEAIVLQPDFAVARMNQLVFLNHQGRYEAAMAALEELEQLQPENSELKVWAGIFTELQTDSLQASAKFIEADKSYKQQLNVLSPSTRAYQLLLINYAVNLKFLGMEEDANKLLEEIKKRTGNEDLYEMTTNFQLRSRKELIQQFKGGRP